MLYNTADTRVFSPCPERPFDRIESGARLFYHGTMAERFGVDVAIQALAELRKTIPGSTLDAYGPCDADYRRRLDQLIADLALKDCVRLHEPVSLERIRRVLDNADLGIVPYQRDDFMELAFSTKMFEYAASGLPIVASRLRPALLVFDDSCVAYATPGNPVSFARHAAALCLAPDRRRKMAENAFKAHESVSGDVMAARYRAVIRGLASGRRGEIADEAGRADAAEGAMPR
ncbi:MAG: glycosyltransferase [Candidatus Sumerlaeota bacterium]|nr:glycosyltransferase [Candidatus Sumerlaeota bacterium]